MTRPAANLGANGWGRSDEDNFGLGPESSVRPPRSRTGDLGAEIIGASPSILMAVQSAERIAQTDIPVLIKGETGTGKELFARHIHERSRREGRLVCVDCGALPDELTESLLFGHDRGAFTGAVSRSEGLIAQADGGTLFLDELSSLPLRGQAKLLRVLETGSVRRVGAVRSRTTDFRLVATVQEDISDILLRGGFRTDLLQRVAGLIIELPRLDDRRGDVPILARHFATQDGLELTREAERLLDEHRWPGNVRELRWTIARAGLFAESGRIDVDSVREAFASGPRSLFETPRVSTETQDVATRRRLKAACEEHKGDPERIAEAFGVARSTLYRWLKAARLELRSFRDETAG